MNIQDAVEELCQHRSGTAYLTPIKPDPPNPNAVEAVYAVYPLMSWPGGETPYLLVTSCPLLKDTCILPVDEVGRLTEYHLVGCVPGVDHERALRSINYEPEVISHARA